MRTCKICKQPMTSGYCINDGEAYYCSNQCLGQDYTPEEWNEAYDNGDGYWTEWEE